MRFQMIVNWTTRKSRDYKVPLTTTVTIPVVISVVFSPSLIPVLFPNFLHEYLGAYWNCTSTIFCGFFTFVCKISMDQPC